MVSFPAIHACAKSYDRGYGCYSHEVQVSVLCGLLFDELHPLFPAYTSEERDVLICAGLLHDIGTSRGAQKHHKSSYELILLEGARENDFCFSPEFLEIMALIARYHRKAVPRLSHRAYADLSSGAQEIVRRLSAVLRIADGLDYMHDQSITDIRCIVESKRIRCVCVGTDSWSVMRNMDRAREKAEPFSEEFQIGFSLEAGLK